MSEGGPVGWFRALVIDARDPERLARFWQDVLGVDVVETVTDWIQLAPGRGGAFLAFQPLADDAEPPGTPRGRLDLEVDDMDAAQARIEELGGTFVALITEADGKTHRRMADPEGNEFTIVLPLPPELYRKVYGE